MSGGEEKTIIELLEQTLGVAAGKALAEEIRHYLGRLGETNDINWIDLMVWRLTTEGVPLPTVIQGLASKAAHLRLLAVGSRNKSTDVMREHAEGVARAQVMFLRGTGMSKAKATKHAANATHAALGYAHKASTLDGGLNVYIDKSPEADLLKGVGRAWAELYPEQHKETVSELDAVPKRKPGKRR